MDHACAIARSIFVTNFHDSTSSKDLWKLCQSYGTFVDVYIPNRRSKAGKRFAFVRLIKVDNVDRLVGNLCTLWIGRMHLHANVVRFERTPSQVPRPSQPVRKATHTGNTFASVVKGNLVSPMSSSPALVLDDTCLEDRDYENCVMGEILQFSSSWRIMEQPIPPAPVVPAGQHVAREILIAHIAWIKGSKEIALRASRKLKLRVLSLYMGNGQREAVEAT
nr:RNA-directed DNA polymerase, eukaryota, nucleotide-binding alpha-beta plait domain protein [Tanacetum cinerariifolium]